MHLDILPSFLEIFFYRIIISLLVVKKISREANRFSSYVIDGVKSKSPQSKSPKLLKKVIDLKIK